MQQPIYLSMWGAKGQRPLRGNINRSHTANDREGAAAATLALWRQAAQSFTQPIDDCRQAADAIQPPALLDAARSHVDASGLVDCDIAGADGLRDCRRRLTDLMADRETSEVRDTREIASRCVNEKFDDLQGRLTACFRANPSVAAGVIRNLLHAPSAAHWPASNGRPLKQLDNVVAKLDELSRWDEQLTDEAMRRVKLELVQTGRRAVAAVVHEVVAKLTAAAYARRLTAFHSFLEELGRKCQAFEANLHTIEDLLSDRQAAAREEQQGKLCSVALHLPGQTSDEVIGGMQTANRCGDITSLIAKLRSEFEAELRNAAASRHPHVNANHATLTELLMGVPPEDVTLCWEKLVQDHAGAGHSLYERVAAFGVAQAANYLWKRAGVTAHLNGRGHDRFGMNVDEVAVVRLPLADTVSDAATRDELAASFRKFGSKLTVVDGSEADREISVCRIAAGWIIAIDSSNDAIVQRYAIAAQHNHPPHLIGLLEDSPLGQASAACVRLTTPLNAATQKENANGDDR